MHSLKGREALKTLDKLITFYLSKQSPIYGALMGFCIKKGQNEMDL